MYELLANLALGFGVVFQVTFFDLGVISIPIPMNVVYCLLGALVGTLIGVLPGVGSVATIAMLLPITFGLPPTGALIMLAGIYYGAQYGGSTTAILVNIPGEATSVVTTLDGHQMARQGRAGPALAIAAIGSFSAGCIATILVAALGAPLTGIALKFGPAEYFSLMVLGLIFAVVLAKGSLIKAIGMILAGLLMSMVGSDLESGVGRMTFQLPEFADGISFVVVAMGVFGFAEIVRNLEASPESREILNAKITGLMPTRADLKAAAPAVARGTVIGSIIGILPGAGAVIASFAAYTLEKRVSQASREVRTWRHRGRRRTGKRQQCRRANLLHSAAHARHSAQRGDGADGRRHDHPRHRAGAAGDDQAAGSVLGHDRLDVGGQPDAGGH